MRAASPLKLKRKVKEGEYKPLAFAHQCRERSLAKIENQSCETQQCRAKDNTMVKMEMIIQRDRARRLEKSDRNQTILLPLR